MYLMSTSSEKKSLSSDDVYVLNKNFSFCKGEVGISDFEPFLGNLPPIDLVYAALPKPEMFNMWYNLAEKKKIRYDLFLEGLFDIFKTVDAPEYHVEVGKSNKTQILTFFRKWGKFSHFAERELLYSAPLNDKTWAMAKCKNPTEIVVFSTSPILLSKAKYSHEYVEELLKNPSQSPLKCFDPVVGKGLLARYALKYGHACYGIEMNEKRLHCAIRYIKNTLCNTE